MSALFRLRVYEYILIAAGILTLVGIGFLEIGFPLWLGIKTVYLVGVVALLFPRKPSRGGVSKI